MRVHIYIWVRKIVQRVLVPGKIYLFGVSTRSRMRVRVRENSSLRITYPSRITWHLIYCMMPINYARLGMMEKMCLSCQKQAMITTILRRVTQQRYLS